METSLVSQTLSLANLKPRIWIEKSKGTDLPREIYIDSYISDCQTHSKYNIIPSIPPKTTRICSYNIHKWMYPSNKYGNEEDVIEIVEKLYPDIIGFQEIVSEAKFLELWSVFEEIGYDYRTDIRKEIECPMMKMSKFLVSDITPPQINKFSTVGLYTSSLNTEFVVCNLHLDAHDSTGIKRKKEMREIIKYLDSEYPTIVMGDFNALKVDDYTEEERQWLMRHNQGYPLDFQTIDVIEEAGFRDTFGSKSFKYSTWSARRVDFIFTRGIKKENIVNTGAFYTTASDHVPIFVDLLI